MERERWRERETGRERKNNREKEREREREMEREEGVSLCFGVCDSDCECVDNLYVCQCLLAIETERQAGRN